MITKLGIKNFKSIKDLELDCKRVNVFIGEPNTGKSNILEALGLLSWWGHFNYHNTLRDYVRFESLENLFFDNKMKEPIYINFKNATPASLGIKNHGDFFEIRSEMGNSEAVSEAVTKTCASDGSFETSRSKSRNRETHKSENITEQTFSSFKFYRFKDLQNFSDSHSLFLMPPYGQNMFSLVSKSDKLKETMQNFFSDSKFKFVIKQSEKQFGFQEEEKGVVTSYPYIISSDTLRHIVFFAIAIESNENASLVFEEPESHAFPFYTKWLGERIALYSHNQFFIATHNPYLLSALIEKTKIHDLNICVTYMDHYETKVAQLTEDQISECMMDEPFFNLNKFIPEGSA